jgi:hypothetical protein
MQRTLRARSALALLAVGNALVLTLALTAADTRAAATSAKAITVRVEGTTKTLVPTTAVQLGSTTVVKDGKPADSCAGQSAAGALELATHGDWNGTWSASYHAYFLTSIEGLTFSSTGAEFWAFWVNDAPAASGICGYRPKPGDSLLFFPDCFGKKCPKSAGVLGVKAPAVATVGRRYAVSVTAYSDAKGAPSKATGATVSAGGASAKTAANGMAALSFTHAGRFVLRVTKPNAVRTEALVCVQAAGAKTCG